MSDDEIIAVVQAHKEGKQIQVVGKWEADRDVNWKNIENPEWQFGTMDYRIVPEPRKPREWNIIVGDNDYVRWGFPYDPRFIGGEKSVRVREVLEND